MRRLLWLLPLALLCACLAVRAGAEAPAPPNIVLILADDLGYGDLSSYGARDMRSPQIDSIGAAGVRFTQFYANSPVCSPTRAALLTGRYPDLVGVPGVIRTHPENNWGHLAEDAILLPKVLDAAGYHSALVGKWHLGLEPPNTPPDRGFDRFHGFLGDMMDDYVTHRRHGINYMRRDRQIIDPKGHATDLFTDWACEYLRRRARSDRPFFLYLAYNAPHTPIQPPEEWVRRVTERERGISPQRAKLVALIEHMDHGIGRVLQTLRETGADRNTLVIFTSDNGGQTNVGASNGPLRGAKQEVYEGGLRVPLLAAWPGRIQPGSVSDHVALTMDLFPTLAEAAGAPFEHEVDGVSFLPALQGQPRTREDRAVIFLRREGGARYYGKMIHAVRQGDWKLVQNDPFGPLELFHLRRDPAESRDLAGSEPERLRELALVLQAHQQRAGRIPWQGPVRRTRRRNR